MSSSDFFVEFRSVVHGYHVYKGKCMCVRTSEILYYNNYTADHLFIKHRLKIIQITIWLYVTRSLHEYPAIQLLRAQSLLLFCERKATLATLLGKYYHH